MINNKSLLIATISLLFFAPLGAAQTTASMDLSSGSGFSTPIEECTGVCTTSDNYDLIKNTESVVISSGSSGYCGKAGYSVSFEVPDNAETLEFASSAERDYWSTRDHLGVMVNGEEVVDYTVEDYQTKTWSDEKQEIDISSYRGEMINLSAYIGDTSTEWCDMGDHGKELRIQNLAMTLSEPEGPQPLCDSCGTPTDPNGDGLYEDVDGDSELTSKDPETLFNSDLIGTETGPEVEYYDFNQNGIIGFGDITELNELVNESTSPQSICDGCSDPRDPDSDGLFEDVDGDGDTDTEDVRVFVKNFDKVREMKAFDFSDGAQRGPPPHIDTADATSLYNENTDDYMGNRVMSSMNRASQIFSQDGDVSAYIIRLDRNDGAAIMVNDENGNRVRRSNIQEGDSFYSFNGQEVRIKEFVLIPENYLNSGSAVTNEEGGIAILEVVDSPDQDPNAGKFNLGTAADTFDSNDYLVLPDRDTRSYDEIRDMAEDLDLETVQHDSNSIARIKTEADMVVYGKSGNNNLIRELEQADKIGENPHLSEVRVSAVPDAYTSGRNVLAVQDYATGDRRVNTMEQRLREILEGDDEHIKLENRKVALLDFNKQDIAVKELKVQQKMGGTGYTMTAKVRWNGEEELQVEPRYIPDYEYEERDDNGNHKEKYSLENGLNTISFDFDPTFVPSGASFAINAGESAVIAENTFETKGVTGPDEAAIRVNGELMSVSEGKLFRVNGEVFQISEIIQTNSELSRGVVQIKKGSSPEGELEVGIEMDPDNDHSEPSESNNKMVKMIDVNSGEVRNVTQKYELQLTEGWNMISVPEKYGGFYVSDVSDECNIRNYMGEKSWRYEDGGWTHPSAVASTEGVFVYTESSCVAQIDAANWDPGNEPVENENVLESGWNMVSVESTTTMDEAAGTCEFQNYQGTPVWSFYQGEWGQLSTSVAELDPSRGYYVYVNQECRLDFGEESTPPTP